MPDKMALGQKNKSVYKIGVYDSRILVLAYSRSQFFADYQKKFKMQSDSANNAKDSAKIKELSVQAMSYQHLMHQMVFGSGSAKGIMNLVESKLPEVAKNAGVVMIVSKFEVNFNDPSVEIVDLTDAIIPLFNPLENIDKMKDEFKKIEPVALDQLSIEQEMLDMYCTKFKKK
jgi:hypothetical protein